MHAYAMKWHMTAQAVEAQVLDNLSEQTTAEKSAFKTAQDIKSLRKQGMLSAAEDSAILVHQLYSHVESTSLNSSRVLVLNVIGSLPTHAA